MPLPGYILAPLKRQSSVLKWKIQSFQSNKICSTQTLTRYPKILDLNIETPLETLTGLVYRNARLSSEIQIVQNHRERERRRREKETYLRTMAGGVCWCGRSAPWCGLCEGWGWVERNPKEFNLQEEGPFRGSATPF